MTAFSAQTVGVRGHGGGSLESPWPTSAKFHRKTFGGFVLRSWLLVFEVLKKAAVEEIFKPDPLVRNWVRAR